ncbi:MAG: hypothetical protein ACR2FI_02025 [Burkholderiales bacterium]|nr:hypothetical protein [Burkholderiales bacterium]MDQ3194887.1 hypothetical protein [Pseudomonadota bacterium]
MSIADIHSPSFSAKSIEAGLHGDDLSRLELRIGELTLQGKTLRNVALTCGQFQLEKTTMRCAEGVLDAGRKWPIRFAYETETQKLELILQPEKGESWELTAEFKREPFTLELVITHGKLQRLAALLPEAAPNAFPNTLPKVSAGVIDGRFTLRGGRGRLKLAADTKFRDLAFSDAAGLHAGEKIEAAIRLTADQYGDGWQWKTGIDWIGGEVFWQPLYFAGGHRLTAAGAASERSIEITSGQLALAKIGEIDVTASWDRGAHRLNSARARTDEVDLAELYAQVLKPMLGQTALADLRVDGRAGFDVRFGDGAVQALTLALQGVSLEDKQRRFAIFDLDANVPWQRSVPTRAGIRISGGEVFRLPLGAAQVPLEMNGLSFAIPKTEIPILDGRLALSDFRAEKSGEEWQWQFGAGLTPVSMERLTQDLGLPRMLGSLSGVIPAVRYRDSTLSVDGALLFKIFDGTIVAKNLVMFDPLGATPRLSADVDMRNLDLDLLTRTFSFGNITGRIDVTLSKVELADWRPVQFDASIRSSPGKYPKKISQTAVQNISALGGAGAVAALQRSFLRFFEQFGYSRIGLSCVLQNSVCEMGGIEPAQQGYVIVEGGGIPAITVLGYNRRVAWQELLDRLKRITQENVKPIVR